MDCESNTEWNDCGSVCNPTCERDFLDLTCGLRFNQPPECGQPRCQCPTEQPYWDGFECISEKQCKIQLNPAILVTTPSPILIENDKCSQMCDEFDNGCQICKCDKDGNCKSSSSSSSSESSCLPESRENARCTICEDPDTMEFACNTLCKQTCQDYVNGIGDFCAPKSSCVIGCNCKPDTPYYLESQGVFVHMINFFHVS